MPSPSRLLLPGESSISFRAAECFDRKNRWTLKIAFSTSRGSSDCLHDAFWLKHLPASQNFRPRGKIDNADGERRWNSRSC